MSLTTIPQGTSHKLTVNVYKDSILRYYGSCNFDVVNDSPLSVTMQLLPVELSGMECRPSYIICDTGNGLYKISWKPYEDTAEYRKGRYNYMLVMDTSQTVEITNDFDRYRKQVIFADNDPFAVSCEFPIGNEKVARFRLFILSESYRQIINDCGGIVYVVKPGM